MIIDEDDFLAHYGTPRKSGRYPYGSGDNPNLKNEDFLGYVEALQKKGLSEAEIARGVGLSSTTELRDRKAIAKNEIKQEKAATAVKLKAKGLSNGAIAEKMGLKGESSVRALLKDSEDRKLTIRTATADMLRQQVAEKKYIDVGKGVEQHLNVSKEKLRSAVRTLTKEGYKVDYVKVPQLGTNQETTIMVLSAPGTKYVDLYNNRADIRLPVSYTVDGGETYRTPLPPLSVSSKRVGVRYAEQGGSDADGVIYVREGVSDVSLGGKRYAQVRVSVDGTHYLKGMAMYHPDMPPGVDLLFNTNKSDTGNKLDAMKPMKDDPDLPFGSVTRQITRIDPKTGDEIVTSSMNIVNKEGDWNKWAKTLSSQMLSKQPSPLAKKQLAEAYDRKEQEFAEIKAMTNPAVKKKLLDSFADDADSSAVHLKAAALPRQANKVILPINSMKEHEVYAPTFRDGENVVLIRFPHGGKFEIPELKVNNRHPEAKLLLGDAPDAIGIHSKVAERLSGADFDGDTVLVIPNPHGQVKTEPALEGLKGFDPQARYKVPMAKVFDSTRNEYVDKPTMTPKQKGVQMGVVSNLITDMTIRGASHEHLAAAVRHSMVVIDAEKHNLDWRRSVRDNGIPNLMALYQNKATGGASTLISKAKSEERVPVRKPRSAKDGGPIDPDTGKKVYEYTGETYTTTTSNKRTGVVTEKVHVKYDKQKSTKLAEAEDAHSLSSGTPIEKIYADHSNNLKALANQARKEYVATKPAAYSPSAKRMYATEVQRLEAALNQAVANSPLERQAQILANAEVSRKKAANPDLEKSDLKKIQSQALIKARLRTGAKKDPIVISEREWTAIQAGAITNHKLVQILNHADLDRVKELATPKNKPALSSSQRNRAALLLRRGHTPAEVADALGVSVSTLQRSLSEG